MATSLYTTSLYTSILHGHVHLLSPMWSRFFVRNDPITNIVMWLMSCLFILVLILSVMEIFQLHKHVTFKKHPRSKYNKQVYCLSPRHGWKIPQIIKTIYMYIITLKQPSVVVKKRYTSFRSTLVYTTNKELVLNFIR